MGKFNLKEELQQEAVTNTNNIKSGGVKAQNYLNMDGENRSYFKARAGNNAVDIIPFTYTTGLMPGKKAGKHGYMLDLYVHKNFNQSFDKVICKKRSFGKPCVICAERARLQELDADDLNLKQDQYDDLLDSYKPKRRAIMNGINLKPDEEDENGGQIQILDEVHYFFMAELLEKASAKAETGDPVDYVDPEDGQSVLFRAKAKAFKGGKFFNYKDFDFEDREESYNEDIVNFEFKDEMLDHGAFSLDGLLNIHSDEEIEAMLREAPVEEPDDDEDEDDDEEVVVVTQAKKRTTRKPKPKVEEEVVEEEKEVEEAVEIEVEINTNTCPYDHEFGTDNMETDECTVCQKKHRENFKSCIMAN